MSHIERSRDNYEVGSRLTQLNLVKSSVVETPFKRSLKPQPETLNFKL